MLKFWLWVMLNYIKNTNRPSQQLFIIAANLYRGLFFFLLLCKVGKNASLDEITHHDLFFILH